MTIRVKNWHEFQHYKDRNPPWIKFYRRLLNDRQFFSLSGDCVKTLVLLWLLAAETEDGSLPELEDISFRLRIDSSLLASQISQLNHWIIVDASDLLATCEHTDSNLLQISPPETETERESDTESETKTKVARGKPARIKTDGSKVWDAYSEAYAMRYGAPPLRNSKANSLCKRFVELVGADSAPDVAAYYLTTRSQPYAGSGHCLELLVRDAQKIHTEWATGRRTTQTGAREGDRLQETGDMWERIIERHGEK